MSHIDPPRHPTLSEVADIGLRFVMTALGCGLPALAAGLLAGCATVLPESIVAPPPPALPLPTQASPGNGAIYAADGFRPMFEDRRARLVGDSLIISITEKTSAGKNAGNSSSKDGKVAVTVPGPFLGLGVEAEQGLSHAERAAANAANNFTGMVTATVTELLPNGHLRVRGEKQVAFDRGTEFIRFSGVVNPTTINAANIVPSTAVADMRVEYRTNTNYDRAAVQSALARFFFSILPL